MANTNPAVENLRRKVTAEHAEFVTITKFLSKDVSNDCDILCLDECSTISNRDMVRILQRAQCKLLVLVGIYIRLNLFYSEIGLILHIK